MIRNRGGRFAPVEHAENIGGTRKRSMTCFPVFSILARKGKYYDLYMTHFAGFAT